MIHRFRSGKSVFWIITILTVLLFSSVYPASSAQAKVPFHVIEKSMDQILNRANALTFFSLGYLGPQNIPPLIPSKPTLLSPANNAVLNNSTVTLSWSSVSGATSYQFYVYYANGNTRVNGSTTLTSHQALFPDGTFTWKVAAMDSYGGSSGYTDRWTFTVDTVNAPPTISDISDQITNENTATGDIAFTIGDEETLADSLIVTATASNTTLVPNGNITLGGSGADRTINIMPAPNQIGAATITVTVDDGTDTTNDAFLLTVNSVKVTKQFYSTAVHDGWLLESSETSNLGGTLNSALTTLRLGDDVAKKQYRSILSFDTSASLPDTAVITNVTLKLKQQGIVGGGTPVTTFQGFVADIKKGFFGNSANLQLADWQAAAQKTIGPFSPSLSSGWYTLDLTSAKAYVNKLATGSGLTQIRLRFQLDDNNNAIANYLSLYSGNAGAASRPQLIVEYYVP